ncbi:MAG TPA: restriction endonuclease [Bacteroidales bacterium]|nr:restriction endonuclease [Bacteroidales bacterium]
MTIDVQIIKASGDAEVFSEEKLRNSLRRSEATDEMENIVVNEVLKQLRPHMTTAEIHRIAFRLLRKLKSSSAARFNIKKAIMELGPTGFPFEHIVGEIFKKQDYLVEVGKIVKGLCVDHEIDVVAGKDNRLVMVECKFHNTPGKLCNVQVPLYIRSRFNDIENLWNTIEENKYFEGWVVTNTRFSGDALQYGNCAGLKLMGWDYPAKGSLRESIEKFRLLPVTVLTDLNRKQKTQLIGSGVLLCTQLIQQPGLLDQMGLDNRKQKRVMRELEEVVSLTV